MVLKSRISPKTVTNQPSKIAGHGFFATEPIKNGEVLAVKAGHIIDHDTLEANEGVIRGSEMQVADGIYIAPLSEEELPRSMIYFNHSCEPNAGIGGNIMFVATRDIEPGEELTVDYAMIFADPDYSMVCNCRRGACRQLVTGTDWRRPALREKYSGHFSWYIEQKIKAMHQVAADAA